MPKLVIDAGFMRLSRIKIKHLTNLHLDVADPTSSI
jgi:hypothetical protein